MTDPAAPSPVHPAAALVADWSADMARDRRSLHSIRAYVATAHRFIAFLGHHAGGAVDAATLTALQPADIRAYLASRRAAGLGNASTARELSAIRAFFSWARGRGHDLSEAATGLKGPRQSRRVPRPLSPADARDLADQMAEDGAEAWIAARDYAVLLMLYGAGLRIAEALSLDGGVLPIGDRLRVTGKRGKTRIVPIIPPVLAALQVHLDLNPWPVGVGEPLFRGVRGGPLSADVVRRAVRRARVALGLPDSATPHALRHSFATHLLARGADLRQLQDLLGHASLTSTQVYTAVDAAHLLDVYRTAHPRA